MELNTENYANENSLNINGHDALALQLKLACRLCLCPDQDVELFGDYPNSVKYSDVASTLLNIEIQANEQWPKRICVECASKLVLFHKFRKKCEWAHNRLLGFLYINKSEKIQLPGKEETDQYIDDISMEILDEEDAIDTIDEQPPSPIAHLSEEEHTINEYVVEEHLEAVLEESESYHYEEEDTSDVIINFEESIESTIYPEHNSLQKHRRDAKRIPIRQCDECGRTFGRKSTLDQHRSTHTGEKNFSCELCASMFTRKSHLHIHMRIHDNVKPYVCDVCCRGFIKSSDLIRHARIHSDERNFQCSKCPKRFKRSADVTTHMRSHTGVKPYKCGGCDKSYSSHSSLKKHVNKNHIGGEGEDGKEEDETTNGSRDFAD